MSKYKQMVYDLKRLSNEEFINYARDVVMEGQRRELNDTITNAVTRRISELEALYTALQNDIAPRVEAIEQHIEAGGKVYFTDDVPSGEIVVRVYTSRAG